MAVRRRKIKATRGLRAKAWWVMRKNKAMTLVEIQRSICTGEEKSADSNLRRWLLRLVAVGVLAAEREDDGILTSNGSYCYVLVRNLGPLPPIVRADGVVFDPNSKEELGRG